MLAAWLRMKYPGTFQGALASSAPILFFEGSVSPYAYNEVATQSFASYAAECPNVIRNGFAALIANEDQKQNYAQIGTIFNMCRPPASSLEVQIINSYVNGALGSMAMVNYPYPTSFLNPMPEWPVHAACDGALSVEIKTQIDYISAIFEASNVYYNYSGWDTTPCLDLYGD
jgi:lysosomal Pro-X carboxypeptidase